MSTLAAPRMNPSHPKKSRYSQGVFLDEHNGESQWFCAWYDHAGRLIKRRLSAATNRAEAVKLAAKAFEKYDSAIRSQLELRAQVSEEELEEICELATFPRTVVERNIREICDRIAKDELGDFSPRAGSQPGLKIFADRTGISDREVHRILEEEERITVGCDTVDKICVRFNLLFHDFIEESKEWASRTGRWADRPGTEDPWPIGYYRSLPQDEGLI